MMTFKHGTFYENIKTQICILTVVASSSFIDIRVSGYKSTIEHYKLTSSPSRDYFR